MNRITANPFLTAALMRQSASLRSDLQTAAQELSSGVKANKGTALRGDFSALSAIDHSRQRLLGYSAATTELGLTATAMQSAISVISDNASRLASGLLNSASVTSDAQLSALASTASRDFDTAIATLNTRLSGRAIFGGVVSESNPLPNPDVLLNALETAVAGAATPDAIFTAVTDWFQDPSGYAAFYQGGAAQVAIAIGQVEVAELPFTALDPAISDTLAALAAVALLDRGLFAGDVSARAEVALKAGEVLLSTAEARALVAGRIGMVEEQISSAKTRNLNEDSALQIARQELLGADPYEVSIRLEDLRNRLDAFYTITARLSTLSLTEYLR